ncbi:hypothetical protein [Streptomyces sp. NPDC052721]|uniref:hypothetical protein n=1 Tax=Streptomyces sp. NPDC052721 TaxID=3154955 RepID=UPI003447F99D
MFVDRLLATLVHLRHAPTHDVLACWWTPSPGARAPGGEVHRGERAVVDTQRHLVTVKDVEDTEDVPGAAREAGHSEEVHGVARPRVVEESEELRPAGAGGGGWRCPVSPRRRPGPRSRPRPGRVPDPGLVRHKVLPGGDCWSVETRS